MTLTDVWNGYVLQYYTKLLIFVSSDVLEALTSEVK